MVAFKSIIALDLETTSLPKTDHNTTKITELALIGCETEHLGNSKQLPRVLHKLVLLFNPTKTIFPTATDISGLTNELLMNLKPFRQEDVELLSLFISRLPSPVCLVSHNGDTFDFPILRRAMVKVQKELPSNVYCVDSLKAFRSLIPITNRQIWTRRPEKIFSTPSPGIKSEYVNSLECKNVCRELFPEEDASSRSVTSEEGFEIRQSSRSNRKIVGHRLQDVYYYYFGRNFEDSHRAESDSKALLSCIMRCEGFLDWVGSNAVAFNSIEPLF